MSSIRATRAIERALTAAGALMPLVAAIERLVRRRIVNWAPRQTR